MGDKQLAGFAPALFYTIARYFRPCINRAIIIFVVRPFHLSDVNVNLYRAILSLNINRYSAAQRTPRFIFPNCTRAINADRREIQRILDTGGFSWEKNSVSVTEFSLISGNWMNKLVVRNRNISSVGGGFLLNFHAKRRKWLIYLNPCLDMGKFLFNRLNCLVASTQNRSVD